MVLSPIRFDFFVVTIATLSNVLILMEFLLTRLILHAKDILFAQMVLRMNTIVQLDLFLTLMYQFVTMNPIINVEMDQDQQL